MLPGAIGEKLLEAWSRLILWVNNHQGAIRLVSFTLGLIILLIFFPPSLRISFWAGLKSHVLLVSMLLGFSLLAISLLWSFGQKLDERVFLFFNVSGSRSIWLDRIMFSFTQVGSAVGAFGIVLVMFFTGNRPFSYEIILGTVTLWLGVEMIKYLTDRSRPFIHLTQSRIVGDRATGRSFPSGHTSQVFFMATLITLHFHPGIWIVLLLYMIALLVGITRIYVGVHYPRDVLAGAILGSAWGLLGMIAEGYVVNGFR
jgi:membrane-associated phospholipid phosphatase